MSTISIDISTCNSLLATIDRPVDLYLTDSEVCEALRANYGSLHSFDVKKVSQSLWSAEREMRRYEDTIRKLEAKVISLRNQKMGLQRRVTRYRSLLAPIRRLPPELLCRIFAFMCTESWNKQVGCSAMRLSQVCAGWRDLVRSTSFLWSSISIDLAEYKGNIDAVKGMLTSYLELSRNSLLSITLNLPKESGTTKFIIDSLVMHSRRWQDFDITVDDRILAYDALFSIKGNLPHLRFLSIYPGVNLDSPPLSQYLNVFSDAPQLGTVIYRRPADFTSEWIEFPWTRIKNFTVQNSLYSFALEQLSLVSMVDEITLYRCDSKTRTLPTITTPTTLHFRSFSIVVDTTDPDFSPWFRWLTLPKLEALQLSVSSDSANPPRPCCSTADIPSFILRSSCNIQTLSLVDLSITDLNVISILRVLPFLSNLKVYERVGNDPKNDTITDAFLEWLTIEHDKPNINQFFLNHLTSLDFRVHAPFPVETLVGMIQSRWLPDSQCSPQLGADCLRCFSLTVLGNVEVGHIFSSKMQILDALRAGGLKLNLVSQRK